ncbi:MAG: acetate/propionate family kinase [Proteobacteria bacterium]|nr:acetate/propionate family kinase [Pseudomonadota bacterium]
MSKQIVVFNAGSSSLKFALYDLGGDGEEALVRGAVESVGGVSRMTVTSAGRPSTETRLEAAFSPQMALTQVFAWMSKEGLGADLVGAGHRVVHGGREFIEPVLVDASVLAKLATYNPMAPSHQPHNLAAIAAMARLYPKLPQIACFDTAFHAAKPRLASIFALPRALTEAGIQRYGFHGLSYDYIASVLPRHLGERADGRVVVAHLGHGASMCAMRGRRSVTTTMGFSALDGLMMGARSGAIDPGVLLYLLQEKGMSAAQLSTLLYEQSGLLGVSGESDDMRTLLASSSAAAENAIGLFVYRITSELGALAATLGGLDALVFTAGIGENSAEIRARVCEGARWLGAEIDSGANARGESVISASGSKVALLALHTNEEAVIATACRKMLGGEVHGAGSHR